MITNDKPVEAPIAAIGRLRFLSDGQGITTLVCFQGCPLNCKMCPNSYAKSLTSERAVYITPQKLYEKVKIDELYFLTTSGGITFGGGEPLLYPEFIKQFRDFCGDSWHICVETSLAVKWDNILSVSDVVDMFYFDCKDIDPSVYRDYTGTDNTLMLENIKKLAQIVSHEKITVRIPLIPGFNTELHQQKSLAYFTELGLQNFDLFTYDEGFSVCCD